MKYLIAPGRALRSSKVHYPAGAEAPQMSPADVALYLADGTIVEDAPAKPKPQPVAVGPKVVEVGK